MTTHTLLSHTDPSAPFAIVHEQALSHAEFSAAVAAVARQLPAEGRVLNLCADRYTFTVGLFAAMSRATLTVLPSSAAPAHLATLAAGHAGLMVLNDSNDNPVPGCAFLNLATITPTQEDFAAPPAQIPAERRVICVHTSGSTGAPTAHYKSFGKLRASILRGAQKLWDVTGGPCAIVGTVPIRHMYGLEFSVLLPALGGGILSAQIPFFPADIAASLAAMPAPRLLVITPFHLRTLLEADVDLPPIAAVLSATAPLQAELAARAEQRFGAPVLEIYGSTETGQLALRQPCRDSTWHALPGITLEARDGDAWALADTYDAPQQLNDRIELLDATSFRLIDRKSNMINVAGKRSSLTFLNQTLLGLSGVRDGVFCLHDQGGQTGVERLAAFVVAPETDKQTILSGLRAHLDPVFLPRPLIFVPSLQRDGNGKIPAQVIDTLLARHLARRS